jgi:hypothetical protein
MDTVLWHLWWVWLAAALGLAILEILVPGFIFLGFAVGAARRLFRAPDDQSRIIREDINK